MFEEKIESTNSGILKYWGVYGPFDFSNILSDGKIEIHKSK